MLQIGIPDETQPDTLPLNFLSCSQFSAKITTFVTTRSSKPALPNDLGGLYSSELGTESSLLDSASAYANGLHPKRLKHDYITTRQKRDRRQEHANREIGYLVRSLFRECFTFDADPAHQSPS